MKDLPYIRHHVTEEDIEAVARVLRSDHLTQGPVVEEFEAALCAYTGAKYAVAVSSGTAALHLAYLATCGSAYRPQLLTSPLSFVATSNAALAAHYAVRFADVDQVTGNLPALSFTSEDDYLPDVVSTVHFAGRAAPIAPQRFDGPYELKPSAIEDACHALGAMDFDGCSRIGSCAHSLATCFSFHPAKALTTGEGGAVTTNDADFAARVRMLRQHGRVDGQMVALGLNYRMPDINAALGLSQLKRLDENIKCRLALHSHYTFELMDIAGAWWDDGHEKGRYPQLIEMPSSPPRTPEQRSEHSLKGRSRNACHLFPVRIKGGRRDEVKAKLNAAGIGVQVHYSPIIPLQPYYRDRFGYRPGQFPNAEAWAAEELSLPLFPEMTVEDVERVVGALREALG